MDDAKTIQTETSQRDDAFLRSLVDYGAPSRVLEISHEPDELATYNQRTANGIQFPTLSFDTRLEVVAFAPTEDADLCLPTTWHLMKASVITFPQALAIQIIVARPHWNQFGLRPSYRQS